LDTSNGPYHHLYDQKFYLTRLVDSTEESTTCIWVALKLLTFCVTVTPVLRGTSKIVLVPMGILLTRTPRTEEIRVPSWSSQWVTHTSFSRRVHRRLTSTVQRAVIATHRRWDNTVVIQLAVSTNNSLRREPDPNPVHWHQRPPYCHYHPYQ